MWLIRVHKGFKNLMENRVLCLCRYWGIPFLSWFCWKNWFCIWYKTCNESIQGSTSFMRDNMWPWILEQRTESVPWCNEIQKRLENTLNLNSNSTWCPRWVVSQSVLMYVDFPLEKCIPKILLRENCSLFFKS